ncbi:MAG: hypothetical protein K2R98_27780 [Gemmataceae bacterium]|nr:hypothetical protein [Gemmataceae bacterium]
MAVVLHMRPQDPPVSWAEFCATREPFAIAVDGYVCAGPRFDPTGPRLNLNHHEEVDRMATRASCAQVLMALRQGLAACFRDESGFHAEVYANDCDEDVCLSWFLLKHGSLAQHSINPALNRLVAMEDTLDATAGAYPFPSDMPMLQEMAWVFEPYRTFRLSGELDRRQTSAFVGVVEAIEGRVLEHISGKGGQLALDTRYRRIGGGPTWAMIQEVGAQAKTGAFADGVRCYVTVRPRPDGNWTYTVGKMSLFYTFDVPGVIRALNDAEGTSADSWGGANTIGGSPRIAGSRLPPAEVERIVNQVVARGARQES